MFHEADEGLVCWGAVDIDAARTGHLAQGIGLLIAAGRRVDLRPRMAQMATGDQPYNMGEFGVAAACLGGRQDAEALVKYLRVALPRGDEEGPHTALAALLHLDDRLGAHHAREFLTPDSPRERYAGHPADPDELRHTITEHVTLLSAGRPTSRAELVDNGTYPPGWRGWHLPPFF